MLHTNFRSQSAIERYEHVHKNYSNVKPLCNRNVALLGEFCLCTMFDMQANILCTNIFIFAVKYYNAIL